MTITRRRALGALAATAVLTAALPARAEEAGVIDARVNLALGKLWAQVPGSRELTTQAKGVLVMPSVLKGGFIVGGAYGEGALRLNDGTGSYQTSAAYYSVGAASVGLQVGVQSTSHVLIFLTDDALDKFRRADGWQIGADAEVTIPDKGANIGIDSTSYEKPVIAIVFGEDGLLIGASLEGAKYSPIQR